MTPAQREFILSLDRAGDITPAEVLAAAVPESSPIHDQFDWDDSTAAHSHRLDQARTLIRRIRVTVIVDQPVVRQIRVSEYIRDPDLPNYEQGYVRTAILRTRGESARRAFDAELGRLEEHVERFRKLAARLGLASEGEAALAALLPVIKRGKSKAG